MRQLTLALRPTPVPCFANFAVGDNAAALDALRLQVTHNHPSAIYLWGEAGCGRSHLLRAACSETAAAGRAAVLVGMGESIPDMSLPQDGLLCIDDVDQLDAEAQGALFRSFIRAAGARCSLLLTGSSPPRALDLREDVRTRIGQCLVFELRVLNDQHKEDILALYGLSLGVMLEPDLIHYLLRHGRRDLPALLATVDALDECSLALHRAPTLPLLREILQQQDT